VKAATAMQRCPFEQIRVTSYPTLLVVGTLARMIRESRAFESVYRNFEAERFVLLLVRCSRREEVRGIAYLTFLLLPLSAYAQSDQAPDAAPVHQIDPVVVVASIAPQPADHATGTVSVIEREEIERGHYTSVVDVLRQVPGIHIEQPGPRGGRASIYTRGLDPNHTLILIDGVRMNDPTNNRGGSYDLSTLDVAGVERIEIVRGPTSAVHGSDAIAGVLDIVTRPVGEKSEWVLDASGGRWGNYRFSGEARARAGIADLSVAGAWLDEGDYSDRQNYRGGNVKTAVGLRLPAGASLRGTLRYADSEAHAFPTPFPTTVGARSLPCTAPSKNAMFANSICAWRPHKSAAAGSTTSWPSTTAIAARIATGRVSPPGFGIPSGSPRNRLEIASTIIRSRCATPYPRWRTSR